MVLAGPRALCSLQGPWEPVAAASPAGCSSVCRCVTHLCAMVVTLTFPLWDPGFLLLTSLVFEGRAHPSPVCPHLNLIHPQRPYFQRRSHPLVPGGREFGEGRSLTQGARASSALISAFPLAPAPRDCSPPRHPCLSPSPPQAFLWGHTASLAYIGDPKDAPSLLWASVS